MKRFLLSTYLLSAFAVVSFASNKEISEADTVVTGAPVPVEIENVECLGINKEAYHATLMPYATVQEAIKANRHQSTFCRSLNGKWKFNYVEWPQLRPTDFYKTDYNVSNWREISVPSNWQVLGYGTPYYKNMGYTFQVNFPYVMSQPSRKYTAFKERNPVGSYRRDFDLPLQWDGRRIFLTFDGVDAGFFLWVNGKKVGYSVNSRNAAEFDITEYVKPGKNMVAAEVYRYTSGSYMEDQDMWRLSGIFRNVTVWSAPQEHIRDFFVQTDLDAQYKDSKMSVSAKVKNYGTSAVGARKLDVVVYNGAAAVATSQKVDVPALKPGEETQVKLEFDVKNPTKWTAETPKLYTTVIQIKDGAKVVETISTLTGFRKIEIKGRAMLINGVPIKLKGVNRHEHWPEVGHAITEAQMIKDLEMIKQGNCNHIRTCHYSDDPRWYELCDIYGIYLVAEANVECHGLDSRFVEDPRMKAPIVDRNVANTENFKNHASVIIWSLGNENGGRNANFNAALAAIKVIDPTRPTQYEPFGIGERNPADIDSRMYTSPREVEQIAKDEKYTKPFYLCEYAHAMFNSMGAMGDYNDIFDKYPSLLGGAIWEYQDQGLWNRRDPNHPILAYGGGFNEYPNDHYFIHKGVVASDRSPKPHYPEMKHAYQWISITPANPAKKEFKIVNRYQFLSLDAFDAKWTLSEDGVVVSQGVINMPKVAPRSEAIVTVPYQIAKIKPGAEYHIKITFSLKNAAIWAPKGFEIAAEQIKLEDGIAMPKVDPSKLSALLMSQAGNQVSIKGTGFSLVFDKTTGTFSTMEQNGVNILAKDGGPKLHLWRAPHRKDDMWADPDWEKNGLKELKWNTPTVSVEQVLPSVIRIKANLSADGKGDFKLTHQVVYTVMGNGTINVDNAFECSKPELIVARIGVRMQLNKSLDNFSYFGRGPMENYSDRKRGSYVGLYSSTVKEQQTPYEKPMECGNHEDVRWAKVTDLSGMGLKVNSDASYMQVSCIPYSDEELSPVEYKIDLPQSNKSVLCISHLTLGVGSYGCGPRPLEQYMVYAKPTNFSYEIQLLQRK